MNGISKRQKEIILFLLNNSGYVTISTIAERFNVSNRTVRNDLACIEHFLRRNNFLLESKTNNGIRIVRVGKNVDDLRIILEGGLENDFDYQDRFFYVLMRCLIGSEVTYNQLADEMQVSKQTVVNHFPEVEDVLENNGIKVIKKPGKGIIIEGKEDSIRDCFRSTLYSEYVGTSLADKIRTLDILENYCCTAGHIMKLLSENKGIKFTQKDKTLILIAYIIFRCATGKQAEDNENLRKFSGTAIYDCLKGIKELADLTESDLLYLTGVVISDGMFDLSENTIVSAKDIEDAEEITEYLLNKLQETQLIDMHNKRAFVAGLRNHLASAICRLKNGILVNNELIEQIKYRIPLMYEFTKKQLLQCEGSYGLEFNENEIAYIAMYLTSAYEDSLREEFNFKVLLVCSFGVTTGAILKSRIMQSVPECNAIGPLNIKEAKEYLQNHQVDLVVSTVDFHDDEVKSIVVGALLSIEDISLIKERLLQISYDHMCSKFLNSYKETQPETKLYISDTIDKNRINIVENVSSWQQAIKMASEPLIADGSLEMRYVEAMIEAVVEYGNYMVLVPEIAFVHAGINDGINRECSSILISKAPILFGVKNPKLIRSVVVMGIKDKKSTSLLNNVYILEKKENRCLLKKENLTVEDVLKMHV